MDESRIRHSLHAHGYELLRPVLTVASPDPEYDRKRARIEEVQQQAERGEIYRMHFAKPVLALLTAHAEQIELVTLPTYSPQLNPVERFWKHLRRNVTHDTFFQTIDRLLEAVTSFFRELALCPDIVCSVAGLAA